MRWNMIYRNQTNDGDYCFGNNKQDYVNGANAVALAIKSKILLFYGEWWEDKSIGIPMFQSIIGQSNRQSVIAALQQFLKNRILEIPEVVSVDTIDIENDTTRVLKVNIRCTVENNENVEVEVNI